MDDNIIIQKTESDKFILVNSLTDRRLRLSSNSMILFKIFNENKTQNLDFFLKKYNELSLKKIDLYTLEQSITTFKNFIYNNNKFKISNHLIINIKIIPEYLVNYIAEKLKYIIPKKIKDFYLNIIFFYLINLLFLIYLYFNSNINFFNIKNTSILSICLILIFIFHELGHAISAKNYGAKPKEIGFGFYLLTPALYCNLSDIWKLSINKRIIVNLSGIYIQTLISFFLILINIFLNETVINQLLFINFLIIAINLNPFLKYDGYWILSDSLDSPNLRMESFRSLKLIFMQKFKGLNMRTYIISLYSVLSILFILSFIYYFVIPNFKTILFFPIELTKATYSLFTLNYDLLNFYNFLKSNILSVIFYYIILNALLPKLLKIIKKHEI